MAAVVDSHEEVRLITRLGGRPAVKANIIKQADANTVVTVRNVEHRLEELAPAFPAAGHRSASGQFAQSGLRAKQRRRPCHTRRCDQSVQSLGGKTRATRIEPIAGIWS